jgi:hypothetical protein
MWQVSVVTDVVLLVSGMGQFTEQEKSIVLRLLAACRL